MWQALVISCLCTSAPTVEVKTLDGMVHRGKLAELSTGALRLDVENQLRSFDLEQVLRVSLPAAPPVIEDSGLLVVELTGGSSLHGTSFHVDGDFATCELVGVGDVRFPTSSIIAVRWNDADDMLDEAKASQLQKQWEEFHEAQPTSDRIVVRQTVMREGRSFTSLIGLEGVLHDVTSNVVHFQYDGEMLEVRRPGKVEGLLYYHSNRENPPQGICDVLGADGSTFSAQSIQIHGDQLQLVTVADARLTLPLSRVRLLDFSRGKLVYLSDLRLESVQWKPFVSTSRGQDLLDQLYQPQRDQNFDGGPLQLRAEGKIDSYEKGLAIHSRSTLVYRLRGSYRRFAALAGIDPAVGSRGHVKLVVSGDDRPLFDGTVSGEDEPVPLDLDITGVRRLKILVDFGDDLDIGDHLNLCEARISK